MAITLDDATANVVAKDILWDTAKKVRDRIELEILKGTICVDPCPVPSSDLLKLYRMLRKRFGGKR